MSQKIELLAPARDAKTGQTAIQNGADAVYIGASLFSARVAAGNSLVDIESLIQFAKPFNAKIYIAMNTLLFDEELDKAREMVEAIYTIGADGLIIQDMAFLEMDLPPIPLIASTQTNNATPEKVKFLEDVGFSRVILARELSLKEIEKIRHSTSIELECFIHGALCVSASGQCYMSYSLGHRSGNRGNCAQTCRQKYDLLGADGSVLIKDKYLLSIKDLNLTEYLGELLDLGVSSFKIEGRLKDSAYVTNTVSWYHQRLNAEMHERNLTRASSGYIRTGFQAEINKTFNRQYTDYAIQGKTSHLGATNSPKSVGEPLGKVTEVRNKYIVLDSRVRIGNGDGLCFFDAKGTLKGGRVNQTQGRRLFVEKTGDFSVGTLVYRNIDQAFTKLLSTEVSIRKITLDLEFHDTPSGIGLIVTDEDSNRIELSWPTVKEVATHPEKAVETFKRQISKLGSTIFSIRNIKTEFADNYFFPVSFLNQIRREFVDAILEQRVASASKFPSLFNGPNNVPYPEKILDYKGNILNRKAKEFYIRHGVTDIQPAAEMGIALSGQLVATTKYCVRKEIGMCPGKNEAAPLWVRDKQMNQFRLEFECDRCGMVVYFEKKREDDTRIIK